MSTQHAPQFRSQLTMHNFTVMQTTAADYHGFQKLFSNFSLGKIHKQGAFTYPTMVSPQKCEVW